MMAIKKIFCGSLASVVLVSTFAITPGVASATSNELGEDSEISSEIYDIKQSRKLNWISVFTKGAWYMLDKTSNKYYSVAPTATGNINNMSLTPGEIYYNSGKNGGISQIDFKVGGTGGSVVLYANTSATGTISLKKINLSISKDSSLKASKSANAGQWLIYRPGSTGNYYARYTTTEKRKWTPYIMYSTTNNYGLGVGKYKNTAKETIETNLITTDNGNYIKPSKSHYEGYNFNLPEELTLKELDMEFFDETLNTPVYSMKHFSVDDIVRVKDSIMDVNYDAESDESQIYFESREEPLQFKGNLKEQYHKGDILNLTFKVKSFDEQYNLYAIDYLVDYLLTSQVPDIEDFNPYIS